MARLIHYRKIVDEAGNIDERVIWEVPRDARHPEGIRYRLAYIKGGRGKPLVVYDNHHPKGHHKHLLGQEFPYAFFSAERLLTDFLADVKNLK